MNAATATADSDCRDGARRTARCVILVPVGATIDPRCEAALAALERRGYAVRRVLGFSAIDFGRSSMASSALADGFDELMWIDSDILFAPCPATDP